MKSEHKKRTFNLTALEKVTWWATMAEDFTESPFKDAAESLKTFSFGWETDGTRIPAHLCEGLSKLGYITIPYGIVSVGANAFADCTGLYSVTFTEVTVKRIESRAFMNCTQLDNGNYALLPSSVTFIGSSAFNGCTSLKWGGVSADTIGFAAFAHSGTESVSIGRNVKSIGDRAFGGCRNLKSITVSESNPIYDSRDNCNALIETATNTLLTGCQTTIIPESVTSIAWYAFYNCIGLSSITFPDNITIGSHAFAYCDGLEEITFPKGSTDIAGGVFRWCKNLTTVTFPSTVTSINYAAFEDNSNLTKVYAYPIAPPILHSQSVFAGIAEGAVLYVPAKSVSDYENSDWASFFTTILPMEDTSTAMEETVDSERNDHDITAPYKVLCDGKLLIINGEEEYTATGIRVE